MTTLILEIGTEEIPAAEAVGASHSLLKKVTGLLDDYGLATPDTKGTAMATPRRLAVMVTGFQEKQEDRETVFTGPKWDVAFDADGNPRPAAKGFARSHGVEPSELIPIEDKKGRKAGVKKLVKGKEALELLAKDLPGVIKGLEFKRTMFWADGKGPFIRPVHYVVAMVDDRVIPFEVFGLQSGNTGMGHKFMHPEPITLTQAQDWVDAVRAAGVEPVPENRKQMILQGLQGIANARGIRLIHDPDLLDEVTNLVEYPFVEAGIFADEFLELPEEVLIEAMRSHQRYFAFRKPDGGLAPVFGVVANTRARDMQVVVNGNQRVLSARLYDAMYFWGVDRKTGILNMKLELGGRMFMQGLGTMADKTARLEALVGRLQRLFGEDSADISKLMDAASLCKADLMSKMVGEFAALQGVMGAYYAMDAGYDETVAAAIRGHYLPRFAGDELPDTKEGAILGIADRVDTILAAFSKGYKPKGGDPYALRRQAVALLRLMIQMDSYVTLSDVLTVAADVLGNAGIEVTQQVIDSVYGFITDRFVTLLKDSTGASTDFVASILDIPRVPVKEAVERLEALNEVYTGHTGFRDLMLAFKRMKNIRQKAPADLVEQANARGTDRALLESDLEKELYDRAVADRERVMQLRGERKFVKILEIAYGYQGILERFFDTVRVLDAPSRDVIINRLALLKDVLEVFNWFGNFAMISKR